VIDPGTGAYYADKQVRNYLSSWEAHNGPRLREQNSPRRAGPFLWAEHHDQPEWRPAGEDSLAATLNLRGARIKRTISKVSDSNGWRIDDIAESGDGIRVGWQFPAGCVVRPQSANTFCVEREGISLWVQVGEGSTAKLIEAKAKASTDGSRSMAGICSPSFRRIERGPYLELESSSHKPCVLRTSFLASPPS